MDFRRLWFCLGLLLVGCGGNFSRPRVAAAQVDGTAGTGLDDVAAPKPAATQPTAVALGKGSYASFPPADAGAAIAPLLAKPLYIVERGNRPVPTNKWWTNLIIDRYAGDLWVDPLKVTVGRSGVNVFFPTRWNDAGTDPQSEFPLTLGGLDFSSEDARATKWGDWTLTFREAESPTRYIDTTLGRGLPYVWSEYHGVVPTVALGADASFFAADGSTVSLPHTGDSLGVSYGGRSYCLFAPTGTHFSQAGQGLEIEFGGTKSFLVLCALTGKSDLKQFHNFAFAIPRDSRMTWNYDPARGEVATTWHLDTALLQGSQHGLIQGWLPHHYRDTANDMPFNGMKYLSPRGTIKCASGTDFHISYAFNGIPPALPAPRPTGLTHDYDEARMRGYLARYAQKTDYGDDTYWGGKSLLQYAQYMAIAQQMHDPTFDTLRATLRRALVDWYTYTPGEKAHYFARYPGWGALVGIKPSYGSEVFNDNHFHYGYFTTASALLGMYDRGFLADYGPMAREVAKQYANWDRNDLRYPYLRTFDVWEGHSWAGGTSSPTGNNQESSSEAVQSWSGLFLLGNALGDKEMTAAGAMGYASETRAAMEYWFNQHGDNFAPTYPHPMAGMLWGGEKVYGTYFSGEPAWIYGINWLPMSPALAYLAQDQTFARKSFAEMWSDEKKDAKDGEVSLTKMGTGLGNVVLSQAAQINPNWAAEQMDQLWSANAPAAHDNDTGGLTYYFIHTNRTLGQIDWRTHISLPGSRVYANATTHTTTYVAYNPAPTAAIAGVFRDGNKVGNITVPAGALVSRTALDPAH